jgi:hypothetical protein
MGVCWWRCALRFAAARHHPHPGTGGALAPTPSGISKDLDGIPDQGSGRTQKGKLSDRVHSSCDTRSNVKDRGRVRGGGGVDIKKGLGEPKPF